MHQLGSVQTGIQQLQATLLFVAWLLCIPSIVHPWCGLGPRTRQRMEIPCREHLAGRHHRQDTDQDLQGACTVGCRAQQQAGWCQPSLPPGTGKLVHADAQAAHVCLPQHGQPHGACNVITWMDAADGLQGIPPPRVCCWRMPCAWGAATLGQCYIGQGLCTWAGFTYSGRQALMPQTALAFQPQLPSFPCARHLPPCAPSCAPRPAASQPRSQPCSQAATDAAPHRTHHGSTNTRTHAAADGRRSPTEGSGRPPVPAIHSAPPPPRLHGSGRQCMMARAAPTGAW